MQNTIMARRISYNWIAIMTLLVVVATLVGFAVGRYAITPSAPSVSSATSRVQAGGAEHLFQLNELLYPSSQAVAVTVPQRNPRLYDVNEMYYPSSASEPTFWNGKPH